MALSVVDLYSKVLPKTNCKDCGFPTCLAFAGMVVSQKHPLENCPHIAPDILASAKKELEQQYKDGKWVQKDMATEALELAKKRAASMKPEDIAARTGACVKTIGRTPTLILPCFNKILHITRETIKDEQGNPLEKNDQTFVFIHMARGGIKKPTGTLKSFKEFPNTVSKTAVMEDNVESPLKKAFSGKTNRLETACAAIGGKNVKDRFESGDIAFEFMAFPKVPVTLLFWDAEEGFEAEAKLLFDETVVEHLDIESIIFLSEHLLKQLTKNGA